MLVYGIPFLFASWVAQTCDTITEGWATGGFLNAVGIAVFTLLLDNLAFYPFHWFMNWLVTLLLPEEKKEESSETLKEMIVVEAIDLMLRFGCFLMPFLFSCLKGWFVGASSVILDLVFLVCISKSHQLLVIAQQFSSSRIRLLRKGGRDVVEGMDLPELQPVGV